jgi:hypothetical protein
MEKFRKQRQRKTVLARVQNECIKQQISLPIFILYNPISVYIKGNICQLNKYLPSLRGVSGLQVEKIKFHKIKYNCNCLTMMN